jgi:hypothetical protein
MPFLAAQVPPAMSNSDRHRLQDGRSRSWFVLHAAVVALHPLSVFLLPWRAGERDARMAIALLRVDPVPRRRYLSAACYVILATFKTLMVGWTALVAAFAFDWLLGLRLKFGIGWAGQALLAIVAVIALASACCAGLTFVTSLYAAAVRQKLWIDAWVNPAVALDGRWPPVSNRPNERTSAAILAILPPIVIPVMAVLIAIRHPPGWMLFLAAISGTVPAIWIANRVVARTPAECYPEASVLTSESTDEDGVRLVD